MINLEYYNNKLVNTHIHVNPELLFVLEGHADIVVESKPFRLGDEDFIVINSYQQHSYTVNENSLIGSFQIPYSQICDLLKCDRISFALNPNIHRNDPDYEEMREVLKDIFSGGYDSKNIFKLYGQYYKFMEILTKRFVVKGASEYNLSDNDNEKRMHKIEEFIKMNYNRDISLNDLAEHLYLSSAYLSKYIKRHFGKNFLDMVNDVRIEHAVSELKYTDFSITKIAMNAGFTNLKSFNRAFTKKYNMTPSTFRKKYKQNMPVNEKLMNETSQTRSSLKSNDSVEDEIVENIIVPNKPRGELHKNWNRLINIGTAEELLQSDVQDHIIQLKNKLHFRYVRFWNIYTASMYLNQHEVGKAYNFNRLDKILDFLVKNHIVPHIEIANKPKIISRKSTEFKTVLPNNTNLFSSRELVQYFFREFMKHLIERYGTEELEKWRFEYWMEENENIFLKNEDFDEKVIENYINTFNDVAKAVKSIFPGIQLGTGGFSIRFGKEYVTSIIAALDRSEQKPEFLTFYVYPYEKTTRNVIRNRSTDPNYLRNTIMYLRNVLKNTSLKSKELYVTEWNMTSYNKNVINDSCYKGAYIVKNLIDCVGLADSIGYWVGSDLYGDYIEDTFFIHGSCGLLTKNGIRKPAWYAFDFMNSLGKYLYDKGENYIITRDNNNNWYIVCHNLKKLCLEYYLRTEESIEISEVNDLFDDNRRLNLNFEIEAEQNEKYRVKILSINKHHGSVQDEWLRMQKPQQLDTEDIEYLKSICIPSIRVQNITEQRGKIFLNTQLEPNEIQLIEIVCVRDNME